MFTCKFSIKCINLSCFFPYKNISSHLYDGDDGNEDRWGTQAVLVEVPASVRLAGQDLIGHIANKAFVQTQPRLVQQDLPLQCAAAIGDGPSETAGALTAHLKRNLKNINVILSRLQHKVLTVWNL